MKKIRIFAVGKLKTPYWLEAAAEYKKRLSRMLELEECIAKDAAAGPLSERLEREAQRLLKFRRPQDMLVCMDERGTAYSSENLAAFLQKTYDSGKTPCFVVGGAYGLAPSLKREATHIMTLSSMTFPHELARVLLFEQIYRAESILAGTGYHH